MRILLVDDEPAALRHLQAVVEFTEIPCEIAGTAENGAEALELARSLMPDIILTDVKMPLMDGIELSFAVKEEFSDILSVVISGYQDFEYLKGAIQSGVADYLLKPVGIEPMRKLLTDFTQKVNALHSKRRGEILKMLLTGAGSISESDVKRYFQQEYIYAAVMRKNGVISRLSARNTIDGGLSDDPMDGYITLRGRDENEMILVSLTQMVNVFPDINEREYRTVVIAKQAFPVKQFAGMCAHINSVLDSSVIIGKNLIITLDDAPSPNEEYVFNNIAKLEHYIASAQYDDLKDELILVFAQWEEESRTAAGVESALKQLLNAAIKYSAPNSGESAYYDVEDAILNAASFGELLENTWGIITRILSIPTTKPQKINTPRFFEEMASYIENNLAQPLSLKIICGAFGISQTYASRLFRKYANMTFSEYLTKCRVEKAKLYLSQVPKIPVKDVAQMVGFTDQFYFSKVFRSITGIPPSEYID